MTGSLEVQLSNALHQRDVARRERDDAEARLGLKQRAADEAVDRALDLARQLAEVRAELERAKPVLDAAADWVGHMRDSIHRRPPRAGSNMSGGDLFIAVDAYAAGPGGCAGHTRKLPVCADCGHRHRWGGECADHSWTDSCPYDAGADCEAVAEERRQCPETLERCEKDDHPNEPECRNRVKPSPAKATPAPVSTKRKP